MLGAGVLVAAAKVGISVERNHNHALLPGRNKASDSSVVRIIMIAKRRVERKGP